MTTNRKYSTKDLEDEFGVLTFANSLEAYRLGEGFTQKDFAKQLGMTPQSLCDLEKGRRIPSIDRAAKIARKLKEPAETWVILAIEDMIRAANVNLAIEVKKVS
jgi:transcriptional regulator with XRE-family HTH domain